MKHGWTKGPPPGPGSWWISRMQAVGGQLFLADVECVSAFVADGSLYMARFLDKHGEPTHPEAVDPDHPMWHWSQPLGPPDRTIVSDVDGLPILLPAADLPATPKGDANG